LKAPRQRARRETNSDARAAREGGGWGEGPEGVASRPYGVKIFARPRFSAAAIFRASEAGAPPNFCLNLFNLEILRK